MEAAPEIYPRLLKRLQGLFIDGIIIPIAAMATLVALTYAGVESNWAKVLCPLLVIVLLEPVAVSSTGGSIGHHIVGLRVRKEGADERISLLAAVVRFVVKTLFGLPAFFVVLVTRKRQALHDLASKSLMVHKRVTGLPAYELLHERTRADEHKTYASVWRRLLVILLYWVLFYVVWSFVLLAFIAGPCAQFGRCTDTQRAVAMGGMGALFVGVITFAVLGWRGKLYGCRKAAT